MVSSASVMVSVSKCWTGLPSPKLQKGYNPYTEAFTMIELEPPALSGSRTTGTKTSASKLVIPWRACSNSSGMLRAVGNLRGSDAIKGAQALACSRRCSCRSIKANFTFQSSRSSCSHTAAGRNDDARGHTSPVNVTKHLDRGIDTSTCQRHPTAFVSAFCWLTSHANLPMLFHQRGSCLQGNNKGAEPPAQSGIFSKVTTPMMPLYRH